MSDGPVINDVKGYTCEEICPHWNKGSGCFYGYTMEPICCHVMLWDYTRDVKLDKRTRLEPREAE